MQSLQNKTLEQDYWQSRKELSLKMAEGPDDGQLFLYLDDIKRCKKYKKDSKHHDQFKPKGDFVTALPHNFQNETFENFINSIFAVCVRLFVQCKSIDSEGDYMYRNDRRWGTGRILKVTEIGPNKSKMCILTAKHVVYDDSEAEKTDVWLYYNPPASGTVKCCGTKVVDSNSEKDHSILECIIDSSKIEEINGNLNEFERIRKRMWSKYKNSEKCMLVSHPHGCIGYFSVGELLPETDSNPKITSNTPSCAGSSGGCVLVFKKIELIHNGTESLNINYSNGHIEKALLYTQS